MKLSDYKLIYISCKFGGDKERIKLCEDFIEEFIKEDKKMELKVGYMFHL